MLEVTDARFQSELRHKAVAAGKLRKDFRLPARAADNLPQRIEEALAPARREGLLPQFPLGTEMTATEMALVAILAGLRGATPTRLAGLMAQGVVPGEIAPDMQAGLERLDLAGPRKISERAMRALVLGAMRSAAAK
jgi:hypothetical protein